MEAWEMNGRIGSFGHKMFIYAFGEGKFAIIDL